MLLLSILFTNNLIYFASKYLFFFLTLQQDMSRINQRITDLISSVSSIEKDTNLVDLQFPELPNKNGKYNFHHIMKQVIPKLEYIKSGSTGHTFRIKTTYGQYAVKLTAYSKRTLRWSIRC